MAFGKFLSPPNLSFTHVRRKGDGNNRVYIIRLLWELTELFYTKNLVPRHLPVAIIFIIVIVICVFLETLILLKVFWHINS